MRLLLAPVLAFALVAACKSSEPTQGQPVAQKAPMQNSKDPAKAKEMIAKGAVVVDVRTPDEFSGDHLPNATNIPIDDFGKRLAEVDALTGGDKAKPVVLHCGKGGRAERAKQALEAAGYTNVVNGGGLDDLR